MISLLTTQAFHSREAPPNERSVVDARRASCLHVRRLWPGATHRERSARPNHTIYDYTKRHIKGSVNENVRFMMVLAIWLCGA